MTLSHRAIGRLAGLTYLSVVVTGLFSLAYVPSQLIDLSDAARTLANLSASQTLFRWGIAASVICYLSFLVLPIILYRLLEPFGRVWAVLMVLLAITSVPISFVSLTHKLAILPMVAAAAGPPDAALAVEVMERLRAYNHGLSVTTIFWGLWLFPFGYLVTKSGVIPRILGVFLMLGCVGYLANFFGPLLWPVYRSTMLPDIAGKPAAIGEIGACLWLLVMGAKHKARLLE